MIPTAPLALRNRLAETILAALGDENARRTLRALAAGDAVLTEPWTTGEARTHAPALRARAAAALAVIAERPLARPASLDEALAVAAPLFDAGLHFEVHELLEPYWRRAQGQEREALRGLIQIAVGYQHLANANVAGARALLAEGSSRVHGRRLDALDLEPLARAAAHHADHPPAAARAPAFPRREG